VYFIIFAHLAPKSPAWSACDCAGVRLAQLVASWLAMIDGNLRKLKMSHACLSQ
jgi:hypothetical protein